MDQKNLPSLLKYYLSCMDAEEASSLELRKNHEYKAYIFAGNEAEERFFTQNLPQWEIWVSDPREKKFVEGKAVNNEVLPDLFYGFPVSNDRNDMLSPLFYIGVEAHFLEGNTLRLLPKPKSFAVNRRHFIQRYHIEDIQAICQELEGDFGSFEARMKAAEARIPSLKNGTQTSWIRKPVLFRTHLNSAKANIRFDLSYLLKNRNPRIGDTALQFLFKTNKTQDTKEYGHRGHPPILEIGTLNPEQEKAVIKGLQEPFSVVTGPPGTGKTQVVTALLASAVFHKQTVLFASNNNIPVDGVYEKLGDCMKETGNWVMRLGNLEKRTACFQTLGSLLEGLDVATPGENPGRVRDAFSTIENKIIQTRAGLEKARLLEEKIREISEKEAAITRTLPDGWIEQFTDIEPLRFEPSHVSKLRKHSAPGLLLWLRRKLFGLEAFKEKQNALLKTFPVGERTLADMGDCLLIDESWDEAILKARRTATYLALYQNWVSFISLRKNLEEQLTRLPAVNELQKLKEEKAVVSRLLLNTFWLHSVHGSSRRAKEALDLYAKDMDDFSAGRHVRLTKSAKELMKFFPIWCTTNQSAGAVVPIQPALFDLVVIDEAGQCDIPSILPLLYRAKRAVLIGDPQQFKHITSLKDDLAHKIAEAAGVTDFMADWSFTRRSAFDRAFSSSPNISFLQQHYRCHPDIIEFSNHHFYEGRLIAQTPPRNFENRLPIKESGLVWDHTAGAAGKAEKGAWNPAEVEKAVAVFDRWAGQGLFSDQKITYGIISPFRKQVQEMKKRISERPWYDAVKDRFIIGTAHSFQGSESDVLIYSPVVSENMAEHLIQFAAAQRDLINVTVTRAKSLLYIVGDVRACQSTPADMPLFQLAVYAERLRTEMKHPLNEAENSMAAILEELEYSFVPQYQLGRYRLDFLLYSSSGEKYDLEVDGDNHLSANAVDHDERRDAYVAHHGFKVLRFTAHDVFHRSESIKQRLMRI